MITILHLLFFPGKLKRAPPFVGTRLAVVGHASACQRPAYETSPGQFEAVVGAVSLFFALSSLGAAQLPLVFERNGGQAAQDVRFLGRGGAEQVALLDGGGFGTHGVAIRLAGGPPRALRAWSS